MFKHTSHSQVPQLTPTPELRLSGRGAVIFGHQLTSVESTALSNCVNACRSLINAAHGNPATDARLTALSLALARYIIESRAP